MHYLPNSYPPIPNLYTKNLFSKITRQVMPPKSKKEWQLRIRTRSWHNDERFTNTGKVTMALLQLMAGLAIL